MTSPDSLGEANRRVCAAGFLAGCVCARRMFVWVWGMGRVGPGFESCIRDQREDGKSYDGAGEM